MRATDGLSRLLLPDCSLRIWPIRRAFAASIPIAILLGAYLASRRIIGALNSELPLLQLAAAATLVLAWAILVRAFVPGRLATWSVAAVLLMFAIACSFPAQRTEDWLVWLTIAGTFLASHNWFVMTPAKSRMPAAESDRVLQRLTRSRTVAGHDVIHGTLLAEFSPGERSVMLYVAFCPPFERLPHIELESTTESRLVQTLHNGAQIEVRLPRPANASTTAAVELYATDAQ